MDRLCKCLVSSEMGYFTTFLAGGATGDSSASAQTANELESLDKDANIDSSIDEYITFLGFRNPVLYQYYTPACPKLRV